MTAVRLMGQATPWRATGLGGEGEPGESGMSLIELLVVLAIVSMAVATAIPSFRGPAKRVELQAIGHDLANRLRTARTSAISSGRPVGIIFDVQEHRYVSEYDQRAVSLPRDLLITITTARELSRRDGGTRLVFFPDGSSTGGRIVLQRDRRQIVIGVEWLTGQTRVAVAP